MNQTVAFHETVILMGWSETSAHGCKVMFKLHSRESLEHFDKATRRRRKRAGQRYHAALSTIDAEPQPICLDEFWFAGANWAHQDGARVAFMVDSLDPYHGLETSDQKAGKPLECWLTLIEIGDDERPIDQQALDKLDPFPGVAGDDRAELEVTGHLRTPDRRTWPERQERKLQTEFRGADQDAASGGMAPTVGVPGPEAQAAMNAAARAAVDEVAKRLTRGNEPFRFPFQPPAAVSSGEAASISPEVYAAIPTEPAKPKGGPHSKNVAMLCQDDEFRWYVAERMDVPDKPTEEQADAWVKTVCGIESKVQLDHDAAALERFQSIVQRPFLRWLRG